MTQAFTKEEVAIAWNSINVDSKGQARTFALSQLKDAGEIAHIIKTQAVDEKEAFKDCELEFSTDQKKLLRDCSDKEWAAQQGEAVLTLREKLS